eukprot:9644095-Karenia_brevis.AAC.1
MLRKSSIVPARSPSSRSWYLHQGLVQWLEREIMRAPMPGYSRVSMDQTRAADFEVFVRMTEMLEEDLSIRADNKLPIDSVLPSILLEPRIQALLVPLPASSGSKREPPSNEVAQLREQVKRLKGAGKGKVKGKQGKEGKTGQNGT